MRNGFRPSTVWLHGGIPSRTCRFPADTWADLGRPQSPSNNPPNSAASSASSSSGLGRYAPKATLTKFRSFGFPFETILKSGHFKTPMLKPCFFQGPPSWPPLNRYTWSTLEQEQKFSNFSSSVALDFNHSTTRRSKCK